MLNNFKFYYGPNTLVFWVYCYVKIQYQRFSILLKKKNCFLFLKIISFILAWLLTLNHIVSIYSCFSTNISFLFIFILSLGNANNIF